MLDVIISIIIGARPVRREHVGQLMELVEVEVEVEVKLVATREARKADPRDAVGAAEGGENKAAWWISTVACARECISNVGEGVGCDEYITLCIYVSVKR
jgi:hypothetical protein